MIGQGLTSDAGIDYVLESEGVVANFSFTGLFVGLVVVVSTHNVVRQ
ncbi:hypothetical protein SAMN04488124_1219 [Halogeometricum limi]|uniref:Uncharacterized protein n=1 Tax=Halogeometricum limi TaxID=555875 RepID=A0A1I6GL98_9EURY|nr:hypothetical protein SAMN04488124_1219 [Halogeometricum limi]